MGGPSRSTTGQSERIRELLIPSSSRFRRRPPGTGRPRPKTAAEICGPCGIRRSAAGRSERIRELLIPEAPKECNNRGPIDSRRSAGAAPGRSGMGLGGAAETRFWGFHARTYALTLWAKGRNSQGRVAFLVRPNPLLLGSLPYPHCPSHTDDGNLTVANPTGAHRLAHACHPFCARATLPARPV